MYARRMRARAAVARHFRLNPVDSRRAPRMSPRGTRELRPAAASRAGIRINARGPGDRGPFYDLPRDGLHAGPMGGRIRCIASAPQRVQSRGPPSGRQAASPAISWIEKSISRVCRRAIGRTHAAGVGWFRYPIAHVACIASADMIGRTNSNRAPFLPSDAANSSPS
jgi:hypothetical protein